MLDLGIVFIQMKVAFISNLRSLTKLNSDDIVLHTWYVGQQVYLISIRVETQIISVYDKIKIIAQCISYYENKSKHFS